MNKLRLYQIMNILLLPYQKNEFCDMKKDVIANLRYSFSRLQRRNVLSASQKQKAADEYYTAERALTLFFQQHTEMRVTALDDFCMLMNLFYPEDEIAGIYRKGMENGKDNIYWIDYFYLQNIFHIARSLITFQDGRTSIRTWVNEDYKGEKDIFRYPNVFDKVEIWNLLCRMVVPDVYIAAFYVEAGLKDVCYLYNQTGNIALADKTLEKILCKGTAETHLHFNAGIEYTYFWQKCMDLRVWEPALESVGKYRKFSKRTRMRLEIPVFRILCAEYLEQERHGGFQQFCRMYDYKQALSEMLEALFIGETAEWKKEWYIIYRNLFAVWEKRYAIEENEGDFLLASLYKKYRQYRTSSEMIFLFRCLLFFRENPDELELLHFFLQYIREKNLYFSSMVQSNYIQGLANFKLFYGEVRKNESIQMKPEERYNIIFRSLSSNLHIQKLEIRIAPNIRAQVSRDYHAYKSFQLEIKLSILESVKAVLESYCRSMEEALKAFGMGHSGGTDDLKELDRLCAEGKAAFPTLGIVFHFIKQEPVDNRIGDMCWVRNEEELRSNHMLIWRDTMVIWAQMIEELRSEVPLLDKYIVGIDAASEENKAEPWIFAPVYAAIRNRNITKPVLKDEVQGISRVNNIGFTYHVGEEFRHLLSGLRHIDEVVRHFFYKPGDRLGHGIALGTDAQEWMMQNTTVVIPIGEQMENLLWIWGNMVYRNWVIEIAMESLEGKILSLAREIYGEILGMTVHVLYDAYVEKFRYKYKENFLKLQKYIGGSVDKQNMGEGGTKHFCKYYQVNNPYGIIWTKEKVLCTFFCPYFYEHLQKPILVHIEKEELGLLNKVQAYVVEEVEQRGIYVEVNPTSNLSIGASRELFTPHIFRLNSRDLVSEEKTDHEVLVTINSDNPMIFNTNNENELAYMYYALTYKGYAKESVLRWIDKVRGLGMDSSFIKEILPPSQQYKQMHILLEEIGRRSGAGAASRK